MIKLLYSVGLLAMISAGVPFALCGMEWAQETPHNDNVRPSSLTEGHSASGGPRADESADVTSPLVRQATAFALYLDPPKPPPPQPAPRPTVPVVSAPRPPAATPKFRLLSTTCHRTKPERSLALISEPGKGAYWIGVGDMVGHFRVESIGDGEVVYRDGSQLHKMAITLKETAELARPKSTPPAPSRTVTQDMRLVNAPVH